MDRVPVELRVGGHTYRVVGNTGPDELQRLASIVDGKLRELNASSAYHPQSLLLVAMALAHELEVERSRRRDAETRARDVETHSRDMLRSLLDRVDAALELVDSEPSAEPPAVVVGSPEI
ncbi:MAG TPA: cell division protein ZapA [Polyangiaceae bacterium]|nr:cell division protein ZapA [Polyangiaceae bacterium]